MDASIHPFLSIFKYRRNYIHLILRGRTIGLDECLSLKGVKRRKRGGVLAADGLD